MPHDLLYLFEGRERDFSSTHVFLLSIGAPSRLSDPVCRWLEDGNNEAWVSIGSIREIAIKTGLGRMCLPSGLGSFLARQLRPRIVRCCRSSWNKQLRCATCPCTIAIGSTIC